MASAQVDALSQMKHHRSTNRPQYRPMLYRMACCVSSVPPSGSARREPNAHLPLSFFLRRAA